MRGSQGATTIFAAILAISSLLARAANAQSAPAHSHGGTAQNKIQSEVMTTADVRRVALASQAPSSAARKAATESRNATAQAIAAGVPVDHAYLTAHPGVAARVSMRAPPDEQSANRYTNTFGGQAIAGNVTVLSPSQNFLATSEATQPIGSDSSSIVRTSGSNFTLGGSVIYPAGTSWYNLLMIEMYSEADLTRMLAVHRINGVRLLRCWGHINGYGTLQPVQFPIQLKPGVFNEVALRRYDFVLDALSKAGIRVILTMTNYWHNLGGIQWYVDTTIAAGKPQELFYSDPRPRAAYKNWLTKITQRTNTVNGRKYFQDPTIFAWELCNECHTNDNFEYLRNLYPGELLYNWQVEMSGYLKNLGVRQMVANGNEGYRAKGAYDTYAPIFFPYQNYLNSGLKGEDFARNLYIPTLDFATIHVYPNNFGMPAVGFDWVNANFIGDRFQLAQSAGKPLLMEEYGSTTAYVPNRDVVLHSMTAAAAAYRVAGTLVWEVFAQLGAPALYDLNYQQPGGTAVLQELAYRLALQGNGRVEPGRHRVKYSYSCDECSDVPPKRIGPTCPQLVTANGGLSCCTVAWRQHNFCQISCGLCGCLGGARKCPILAARQGISKTPVPPAKTRHKARKPAAAHKLKSKPKHGTKPSPLVRHRAVKHTSAHG